MITDTYQIIYHFNPKKRKYITADVVEYLKKELFLEPHTLHNNF